ncbi:LysM peptidoglycan-binding domain-containing protein, partial [Vibrio sp. 1S139]
ESGVARAGSLGGYRNQPVEQVEQAVSVFASLPPLSASVVEYEKIHSEHRNVTQSKSSNMNLMQPEKLKQTQDVDDVYIVFADEKADLQKFAKEVYLNDADEVIQHIIEINPHLKRTFHFLIKGMPIVVSPWGEVHPDEADAISQVSELAELFFTLSDEQQEWFSEHHEEFASVMLTSTAMPDSSVYEVNGSQVEESNFTNQMIASAGAGVVGMKTQSDRIQKAFQQFDKYSKEVAEATKGIKGDTLKSNPTHKAWRKRARDFQSEIRTISTQFGAPNYIKKIQANKVNNYLNVGKKQLYKAKDFSKAVSGIDMTALYKKSMEFSKLLGRAAWVATIFGVRDNFMDIAKVCAKDDGFSEACVRAGVKNTASIGMNVFVGEGIGFVGTRLAPTTKGLSIIPMVGGLYFWGLYGGDVSNYLGDKAEYAVFDMYEDITEIIEGLSL